MYVCLKHPTHYFPMGHSYMHRHIHVHLYVQKLIHTCIHIEIYKYRYIYMRIYRPQLLRTLSTLITPPLLCHCIPGAQLPALRCLLELWDTLCSSQGPKVGFMRGLALKSQVVLWTAVRWLPVAVNRINRYFYLICQGICHMPQL